MKLSLPSALLVIALLLVAFSAQILSIQAPSKVASLPVDPLELIVKYENGSIRKGMTWESIQWQQVERAGIYRGDLGVAGFDKKYGALMWYSFSPTHYKVPIFYVFQRFHAKIGDQWYSSFINKDLPRTPFLDNSSVTEWLAGWKGNVEVLGRTFQVSMAVEASITNDLWKLKTNVTTPINLQNHAIEYDFYLNPALADKTEENIRYLRIYLKNGAELDYSIKDYLNLTIEIPNMVYQVAFVTELSQVINLLNFSDVFTIGNRRFLKIQQVTLPNGAETYCFSLGASFGSLAAGETMVIDPSVASTTTKYSATQYGYQRCTFYDSDSGRHWVVYTDGFVKFASSTDGISWDLFTPLQTMVAAYGRRFSVWYDGNDVHCVWNTEASYSAIYYRKGDPQSDGNITWSAAKTQVVMDNVDDLGAQLSEPNLYNGLLYNNTYTMDTTIHGLTLNWATEVDMALQLGGAAHFKVDPYTSNSLFTTSLPSFFLKGWQITRSLVRRKVWALEGRKPLSIRCRNPDNNKQYTGKLYARMYKSSNINFSSGVTALTAWTYTSLSMNGYQVKDVIINLEAISSPPNSAFILEGEYVYLSLVWKVDSANATYCKLQIEGRYGYSDQVWTDITYRPTIAGDGTNFWIGYYRWNGIANNPFMTKINTTSNVFKDSQHFKLNTANVMSWGVLPICLSSNNMYALYCRTVVMREGRFYGRLWSGASFGSEENIYGDLGNWELENSYTFGAVADTNDNIHLVGLKDVLYDIQYTMRNYSTSSWSALVNVETTNASRYSSPVLSINKVNDTIYCFWGHDDDHIRYSTKAIDGSWTTPVDWISTNIILTTDDGLSCSYEAYSNIIGLAFLNSSSSPYDVMYDFLSVAVEEAEWQTIMSWGITLLTRQWLDVASWDFTLLARQWQDVASWFFTLVTVGWRDIASWSITLPTRQWLEIASWSITLLTRQWIEIAFWTFNLLTRQWSDIASWSIMLITREWQDVASWFFTLVTRDWIEIGSWTFTLLTRGWQTVVSWTITLLTMGWKDIASWSIELFSVRWNIIASWSFTLTLLEALFPFIWIIMAIFMTCLCLIVLVPKNINNGSEGEGN